MAGNGGRYPKTQPPKNSAGKHVHPSYIHAKAFDNLQKELRELFPKARINNTSTFEWMIEQLRKDKDPELREYIETRDKLIRLNTQEEPVCQDTHNNSPDSNPNREESNPVDDKTVQS